MNRIDGDVLCISLDGRFIAANVFVGASQIAHPLPVIFLSGDQ
jgi:hypothetical protein